MPRSCRTLGYTIPAEPLFKRANASLCEANQLERLGRAQLLWLTRLHRTCLANYHDFRRLRADCAVSERWKTNQPKNIRNILRNDLTLYVHSS